MMKLSLCLCAAIMFFGIIAFPSDKASTKVGGPYFSFTPAISSGRSSTGGAPFAVPEASTLIMLGSGLVGLAEFGRKMFKKYIGTRRISPDNGGRRRSQSSHNDPIPDRRSGKDRRSGLDRR